MKDNKLKILNELKIVADELQQVALKMESFKKKISIPVAPNTKPHKFTNEEWDNFFSLRDIENDNLIKWRQLETKLNVGKRPAY